MFCKSESNKCSERFFTIFSRNVTLFVNKISIKYLILFSVGHRNQNHRNSTAPIANMINSTKQVNKVKPNITRPTPENVVSPGYNSR